MVDSKDSESSECSATIKLTQAPVKPACSNFGVLANVGAKYLLNLQSYTSPSRSGMRIKLHSLPTCSTISDASINAATLGTAYGINELVYTTCRSVVAESVSYTAFDSQSSLESEKCTIGITMSAYSPTDSSGADTILPIHLALLVRQAAWILV
ncbi:hypothetical protein [Candidatus Lariskella endosymbiont of Epinotia ramella]|uniref:hypothetical protein n=1 Tax=Candidatus Lariskella endosymbiont of Epinotia ramella TaxID=3066224 RepID=UPI0030D4B504